MEKDQKIINKFLELFPDNLADRIFRTLESNWIQDNDLELTRNYLDYTDKFGLSFNKKILEAYHSKFYNAVNALSSFMGKCFFRLNPKADQIVLHPDVKNNNPKMYKKFANELSILLEDTEKKYNVFRKSIEGYLLKDDTDKIKTKEQESKKYSDANEDILLKLLNIKIKGNYIIRGNDKEEINPTDKALIYFLYFKSMKNVDECFSLGDLSKTKEIGQSERYIKNRIADVNKSIRRIIAPNLRVKIGRFIKNERKRGYHLNPRILLTKPKK